MRLTFLLAGGLMVVALGIAFGRPGRGLSRCADQA
jgi:hypothetical protein